MCTKFCDEFFEDTLLVDAPASSLTAKSVWGALRGMLLFCGYNNNNNSSNNNNGNNDNYYYIIIWVFKICLYQSQGWHCPKIHAQVQLEQSIKNGDKVLTFLENKRRQGVFCHWAINILKFNITSGISCIYLRNTRSAPCVIPFCPP